MATMTADLLSFHSPRFRALAPPPDLPVQAVPLLDRLHHALRLSAELLAACEFRRHTAERNRAVWGEPPLFFFDRTAQAERERARPIPVAFPDPYLPEVAARLPAAAAAWHALPDLLDDVLTVLPASVGCRRVGRATAGLRRAAETVGKYVPAAQELAELLAVPDEEVLLVVDVDRWTATRVLLTGIADIHQLMILLADELPQRRRPDPRLSAAYRDAPVEPDAATAVAPFQLLRPAALRQDGTLPQGFAASDHWYWGPEAAGTLPRENGERVVLLTAATVPHSWDVGRRFPRMAGRIEFVESLSRSAVSAWFRARCPAWFETSAELSRAA